MVINYRQDKFKIFFVDRETLFIMLLERHRDAMNWQLFYEENQVVVNNILKK